MKKLKNLDLKRLSIEQFRKTDKNKIILILDNIRSLHNIGSIFRTADAFLIEEIHLCGITARPPHKDIEKTALGATLTVQWKYFSKVEDSINNLKKEGWYIIGVEQTDKSTPLHLFQVGETKLALIFGHEVDGISTEALDACDTVVEVPQFGTKHSLNVAVCAGIVVWDIINKIALQ